MNVIGYDKFVTAERFRELGVEGVESADELFAGADFISLHLPKTPETIGFVDADAIAKMRDGVRIANCARGELIDLDALVEGLESGKVAGAALDVFPEEPFTDHPVLARDDVVVTPHLGASTTEAQDRAGIVTAEQVTAALNGGVVTTAVNIAAVRPEVMEALAPFVPLCEKLGCLAQGARQRGARQGRGRVPRAHRRGGHAPARHRRARRDPQGPHRGGREPRQRAPSGRAARDRARRDRARRLRRLHRAGHRPAAFRRRRGRGRRHGCRPAQRALPRRRLGPGLLPALRRRPRDLPLRRPARDDRPRRLDLRRGGREHRLGGRRRRDRGRAGRDGADHRRARSTPPRSTASSSSRASRSAGPFSL